MVTYASVWSPDAERARTFYGSVLDWRFSPDGRAVEGKRQSLGVYASLRKTTFLAIAVPDVESAVQRVRDAGGTAMEPTDEPWGRTAMCTDDQGLPFALHRAPGWVASEAGVGEIAYLTMNVPDSARARAFYGAVFGWKFTPGRVDDGWGCENMTPMLGMHGGHEEAAIVPMYVVGDITEGVARVRAAGGTATEPATQPYGITSDCVDDQGVAFYLGQM